MKQKALCLLIALLLVISMPVNALALVTDTGAQQSEDDFSLGVDPSEYGFRLVEEIPMADDSGIAYRLEHEGTGATLVYINVNDEEKSFGLGFKIEPENNHGANHVLEHSLLMGSEKYPSRNAFTHLISNSLATYINALTFPDFTLYPVASKNDKDFYNLMSVYLDVVFDPLIIQDETVFRQEGIRYELTEPEADITATGVVYSEMKTYYSDYNWVMRYKLNGLLFPDTCLQYESGGTPDGIPDLTYDELVSTYTKYYTPSNSMTFLYGKQDMAKSLGMIGEYFSRYEKTESLGNSEVQPYLLAPIYAEDTYAVASEDVTSKPQIGISYQVNLPGDIETTIGLSMLANIMFAVTSAPVFRTMLDTGWMTYINGYLDDSTAPYTFNINCVDVDPAHVQDVLDKLDETIGQLAESGIDKEYIRSILSYFEYQDAMMANQTAIGISMNESAMRSFRQYGDPFASMKASAMFDKDWLEAIEEKIDTTYFEDLLREYIIDNKSKVTVVLYPERGKEQKAAEAFNEKLQLYKATLTPEEIDQLVKDTSDFVVWQNTPDAPEVLASLPSLKLTDLITRPRDVDVRERQIGSAKVIHTNVETHGINAVNMYFDISHLSQKELQYANLYTNLLGYLPTEQYNEQQLDIQLLSYLGSFMTSVGPSANYFDANVYTPTASVSFSTLPQNIEKSLELVEEIVTRSNVDNMQSVSQILSMQTYSLENSMDVNGPLYAAYASLFKSGQLENYLYGMPYYEFATALTGELEAQWDGVAQKLSNIQNSILNQNNLVIGFTGSEEDFEAFCAALPEFIDGLSDEPLEPANYVFEEIPNHAAYTSAAQTLTVIMAGDSQKSDVEYSGGANIMGNILWNQYLWPQIREQGGAYHAGNSYSPSGFTYIYSMYDPNLSRTLDVFRGIPEFLRNLEMSDDELEGLIVSAVNSFDESFTPVNLWNFGVSTYMTGLTIDELNKLREEILATDLDTIRAFADMYQNIIDQDKYFVGGSETLITAEAELFDKITPVKK